MARTSLRALAVAALLAGGSLGVTSVPSQAAEDPRTQGCISSVPEPDGTPVDICYTLYRPAGATAEAPVPLIFHSHGWGGSRTNSATAFADHLAAGFGVLSFDQRGFGASGGKAHVESPDFEGKDVQGLVDLVAGLDWVAQEAPGDPIIGAIGGSYGGGYQFVGAFSEILDRGATRFDALAPEITWWDVKESLAPSDVARTTWVAALYAAGMDAHTDTVHKGFAYGTATGQWPKGQDPLAPDLDAFFEKNGPRWHAENGRLLDIPVLFGQGFNDNLFNMNQGLKNWHGALTDAARAESIFVGYNGGHALPNALPAGYSPSGDPCSAALNGAGGFGKLALRFLTEELKGEATGLTGHGLFHMATAGGSCVTIDSTHADTDVALGTLAATSAGGAVQHVKVADGPITVIGTPTVSAEVTSAGVDSRLFFGLSTGATPATARVVQNNLMPLREATPVVGAARTIELPAVAVQVPAGESLYLTISPVSDMSIGHGSRTPAAVVLDGTTIHLPVVQ